jgi:hypothetical protein
MYAKGSQLPVVTNINPINPIGSLADGRPIYSTTASAATRLDPRFNQILEVNSIGDSTFKSMTIGTTKRFAKGLSFNAQYSLGKGLDNTPLLTQLTVQAESGRSDPSNIDRDLGPNPLDIRHSFNGNIVYLSENHSSNAIVRQLLSGSEIGVLLQINSGLPLNIGAVGDLNWRWRGRRPAELRLARVAVSAGAEERGSSVHPLDSAARVDPGRNHRRAEERVQHRANVERHHDHGCRRGGQSDDAHSVRPVRVREPVGIRAAEIPAGLQDPVLTGQVGQVGRVGRVGRVGGGSPDLSDTPDP